MMLLTAEANIIQTRVSRHLFAIIALLTAQAREREWKNSAHSRTSIKALMHASDRWPTVSLFFSVVSRSQFVHVRSVDSRDRVQSAVWRLRPKSFSRPVVMVSPVHHLPERLAEGSKKSLGMTPQLVAVIIQCLLLSLRWNYRPIKRDYLQFSRMRLSNGW